MTQRCARRSLSWCRLRSKEGYQEFLKTLNLFAQEIITRSELAMMVQDILSRFPDLVVCLMLWPLTQQLCACHVS